MPKLRGELLGVVLGSTGGALDGRLQSEHGEGYRRMYINGECYLSHRAVWTALRGPLEPGQVVHHRDGDRANNKLNNLQAMSCGEHSRYHARKRGRDKK